MTVDVHTYVAPALECVYDDSSEALRSHWERIERRMALTLPAPGVGDWPAPYLRIAEGEAPDDVAGASRAPFPTAGGGARALEPGVLHDNPRGRLRAMDALGVAAHLISPALRLDVDDAIGSHVSRMLLDAYNRYLVGYCEAEPARLRAVVQLHGNEPHWSADQLDELAQSPAVAACSLRMPPSVAPDSPRFAPIWAAIERTGLPLLHRPTAGAWWTPRRLLPYLAQTGIMDARPGLRLVFAGWPAGWLADWCESPDSLLARYARAGRVLAAIDATEPARDVRRVVDAAGDAWLLWQTGFPFGSDADGDPASLPEPTRTRVLCENAAACLRR